jgi:cytochrome c
MRWCAIVAVVIVLPVFVIAQDKKKDAKAASYARDIKPILENNCSKCHSGDKPKGGFDVSSVESMMKGSKKSKDKTVVGGKPDASQMYKLVSKGAMPPKAAKQRPSKAEIQLIHKWIKEGAKKDK